MSKEKVKLSFATNIVCSFWTEKTTRMRNVYGKRWPEKNWKFRWNS